MSLTKVTYSMIEGASLNVLDFGASPSKTATQNVTAFQAALDKADALGGATVVVPAGTYLLNDNLLIYKNTTLIGEGQEVSKLSFSHTGNGIESIWPIDSSTAVNIKVLQLGLICTNVANTGGGFFDLCGTYVSVCNCFIQGFAYGIIFDQTEIADIQINNIVGNTIGQIWLVDGPFYTLGVEYGFTNGIVIYGNQLNAAATANLLIDDGYANHYIAANNFNGGLHGIRATRAVNANIIGNNFEGNAGYSLFFAETNSKGVAPSPANPDAAKSNAVINVEGNALQNFQTSPCVYISNISNAQIINNSFYVPNCTSNVFEFANPNTAYQVTIFGNSKSAKSVPWFNAGIFNAAQSKLNYLTQLEYTECQTATAAGQYNDTPNSMQGIYIGSKLWVVNANGTNGELVTVENATSAIFTVTYTTSKSNPHYVTVIDNSNITGILDNTGTPSVYLPIPAKSWETSGTTTITNFINGNQGQIITIMSKHAVTIDNGSAIILAGGVDFVMKANDTLTLIYRPDYVSGTKWVEIARMVS